MYVTSRSNVENWANAALDCILHLAFGKDTYQYTLRILLSIAIISIYSSSSCICSTVED